MKKLLPERRVARLLGGAVLLAVLCGDGYNVRAAGEDPPGSAVSTNRGKPRADLTLELPIKAGQEEFTPFKAAVPEFALVSAKLHFHPGTERTRLMIGVEFASRSVGRARLEVTLLHGDKERRTIHHLTHVEELGPEEVRKKGRNLDLIRKWDAMRALWFDVPKESREADVLRVEAHLDRGE